MTAYRDIVLADQPVSYWRLGESFGTVSVDEVDAHSGTYVNSPALGIAGAIDYDDDTAVTMNGTNQFVNIPYSSDLNPTAYTLEAWVKLEATDADYRAIIAARQGFNGYTIYASPTGTDKWEFWTGNGSSYNALAGPVITFGSWTHVVATNDGTYKKLYINGVLVAGPTTGTFVVNPSRDTCIGAQDGGVQYFLEGSIDEVAIYDYALDGTQINNHYSYLGWENDETLGSIAEDLTLPVAPENVTINVSQTRVQVLWESPIEGDSGSSDESPDLNADFYVGEDWDEVVIQGEGTIAADLTAYVPEDTDDILQFDIESDDEIAYFQVQLATDVDFTNIVRHDRMVRGHTRTWRYHKPSNTTFYARVRSVDVLGNKSEWVTNFDTAAVISTPSSPAIEFKKQGRTDMLRAIVSTTNTAFADEDISTYRFQLREVEFTRLSAAVDVGDTTFPVDEFDGTEVPMDPGTDSPDFTAWIEDEEVLVTAISGAQDLNWTVTRAQSSTTATTHASGKRLWFFGKSSKNSTQIVGEDLDGVTEAVFRGCEPGARYRARVQTIDSQNRYSAWSDWSPIIKAAKGASATEGGGGTVPGVDTPPGLTYSYPYERILRLQTDIVEGNESEAFTDMEGTLIAGRSVVGTAGTGACTVDVWLNGGPSSVLSMTIPANETMSDITFVNPPLYIGQKTGQPFYEADDITIKQTTMSTAGNGLTVYLYIYLPDGT